MHFNCYNSLDWKGRIGVEVGDGRIQPWGYDRRFAPSNYGSATSMIILNAFLPCRHRTRFQELRMWWISSRRIFTRNQPAFLLSHCRHYDLNLAPLTWTAPSTCIVTYGLGRKCDIWISVLMWCHFRGNKSRQFTWWWLSWHLHGEFSLRVSCLTVAICEGRRWVVFEGVNSDGKCSSSVRLMSTVREMDDADWGMWRTQFSSFCNRCISTNGRRLLGNEWKKLLTSMCFVFSHAVHFGGTRLAPVFTERRFFCTLTVNVVVPPFKAVPTTLMTALILNPLCDDIGKAPLDYVFCQWCRSFVTINICERLWLNYPRLANFFQLDANLTTRSGLSRSVA